MNRIRIRLPRIPRPHWPRRKDRPADTRSSPAVPEGALRRFRTAALWAIGVLIAAASGAAFTESYRGLYVWATHHGLHGFWAAAFPVQVDVFIAVGELVLFVAMVDGWRFRDRLGAWTVSLLGLAVSVAGNIGHLAAADVQSRATAAVPPLAAFAALWLGLAVLKRVVASRPGKPAQDAPETPGLPVLPFIPDGSETAAMVALWASVAAQNPLSGRQLETRFGLSRAQATKVRQAVLGTGNGHAPGDEPADALS